MMIKICEYLYFGARTVEHKIEEVVSIKSADYIEPTTHNNGTKFIGYDYPTTKRRGSLIVCLKDGTHEVYPASNWLIEF